MSDIYHQAAIVWGIPYPDAKARYLRAIHGVATCSE